MNVPKVLLVINGGSTLIGAFAIKIARLNPLIDLIIATVGSGAGFVKTLGGVDDIIDYRSSNIIDDLRKALGGKKLLHVFEALNLI
jgi:NADPH2:quinone reductase